jgi:hypothetical protein
VGGLHVSLMTRACAGRADLLRTSKYHRTQIRRFTGFRECGVVDADKATDWLIEGVCQSERRPERVRVALLAYLREERIERRPRSGCLGWSTRRWSGLSRA